MNANLMFAPLSREEAAVSTIVLQDNSKVPIIPVPLDAPSFNFMHPKFGAPTKVWPYHNADNQLVGFVCRWDHVNNGETNKLVLPVTFCELGNGKRGWRAKGIPAPRPLYATPEILRRRDDPVLICEGEKARDAAAILFPDMVATTPAHGAKSPHLTDFGPCAGRVVVIATDYDEPGRKSDDDTLLRPGREFGDKVCERARAAGAIQVLHLRPERLGAWVWHNDAKVAREQAMPDGWDLADALDEGWTVERVAKLRDDPAFLAVYQAAEARNLGSRGAIGESADHKARPRWSFRLVPEGVEKRVEHTDKHTGIISDEWRWFCSGLEVISETRSSEGEEWGRLLAITDRDGLVKHWSMPMAMLAGDGTAYRERLLSLGLVMAPGKFARDALHEYISTARPKGKARCVSRIGWQGKSFIGFDQNFGGTHE